MKEAIFQAQNIFKLPGQGVIISGSLKNGLLRLGMVTEAGGESLSIVGITLNNQGVEEVAPDDLKDGLLSITLPTTAEKVIDSLSGRELIFKKE